MCLVSDLDRRFHRGAACQNSVSTLLFLARYVHLGDCKLYQWHVNRWIAFGELTPPGEVRAFYIFMTYDDDLSVIGDWRIQGDLVFKA